MHFPGRDYYERLGTGTGIAKWNRMNRNRFKKPSREPEPLLKTRPGNKLFRLRSLKPGQSRAKVVILSFLAVKTPKTPLPHATRKPLPSRPETCGSGDFELSGRENSETRGSGDFEFSGRENSEIPHATRKPPPSRPETRGSDDFELSGRENSKTPLPHATQTPLPHATRKPLPSKPRAREMILSFLAVKTPKTPLPHATRKPPPSRAETRGSGDFELSGREHSENTISARHPQASPLPGQRRAGVVILSFLAVKTPKTPLPHATRKTPPSRPETRGSWRNAFRKAGKTRVAPLNLKAWGNGCGTWHNAFWRLEKCIWLPSI